jgi:hypothetical protein
LLANNPVGIGFCRHGTGGEPVTGVGHGGQQRKALISLARKRERVNLWPRLTHQLARKSEVTSLHDAVCNSYVTFVSLLSR